MILGMSTAAFTEFHVLLSLIGIVSGIVVLVGMLNDPGRYDLIEVNGELILIRPERSHREGIASPPVFSPDARARCHDVIMAA